MWCKKSKQDLFQRLRLPSKTNKTFPDLTSQLLQQINKLETKKSFRTETGQSPKLGLLRVSITIKKIWQLTQNILLKSIRPPPHSLRCRNNKYSTTCLITFSMEDKSHKAIRGMWGRPLKLQLTASWLKATLYSTTNTIAPSIRLRTIETNSTTKNN